MTSDSINIGYFVFEPKIFTHLESDSVLEEAPLLGLAHSNQLASYHHDGFWQPMDTYREFQDLNALWDSGAAPWRI